LLNVAPEKEKVDIFDEDEDGKQGGFIVIKDSV